MTIPCRLINVTTMKIVHFGIGISVFQENMLTMFHKLYPFVIPVLPLPSEKFRVDLRLTSCMLSTFFINKENGPSLLIIKGAGPHYLTSFPPFQISVILRLPVNIVFTVIVCKPSNSSRET